MRKRWILAFLVILLVGCGSGTTVVTVVVTNPPATPGVNAAATATRTVELTQLATALAPTAPPSLPARPTDAATPSPVAPATNAGTIIPTSQPGLLNVVAQGYGQNERSIGYAFIVENADPKTAVDFSQFRVSAFDAAGTVLRTEAKYIAVIYPGQRLGVAGELYLPQNVRVVNVDFALTPGRARPFAGVSPLSADAVVFQGDPLSNAMITGVVKSAFPQALSTVVVSAIAYDARGVIIGGGQQVLDHVPANGQATAEVSVTVTGLPARVEMYPTLSV